MYKEDFMKKCIIFGALKINTEGLILNKKENDIIIAADKGLETLKELKIRPDYIIGDFDSLGYAPKGENIIKHPKIKDDTDTMLCVKKALNLGYKYFEIYGCIGGRLDHTIANIQTASFVAENKGIAVFFDVDNKTALTVIKNDSISFTSDCSGNISVFSVCNKSVGINETGLLYEVSNGVITADFPLGVSNEFIGKNASISVENGKMCIIWDIKTGDFKFGGNYE